MEFNQIAKWELRVAIRRICEDIQKDIDRPICEYPCWISREQIERAKKTSTEALNQIIAFEKEFLE